MGKKDFCCANGCNHDRSKGATCNFFKFSEDSKLRAAWLTKVSRVVKVKKGETVVTKEWKPSKSSKLCGCHFETPPPTKSRKKWFTIPTIFSHRPASAKPARKPPKERAPLGKWPVRRSLYIPAGQGDRLDCNEHLIIEDAADTERDPSPDVSLLESEPDPDGGLEAVEYAGHNYLKTVLDEASHQILHADDHTADLIHERESLVRDRNELEKLKETGQVLNVEALKKNDKLFQYYTGLKADVFSAFFTYLEPKAKLMKYPHGDRTHQFQHHAEVNKRKPGKVRSTTLEKEMFYTLVKLKLGLQTVDCANRFGISPGTYSSIFTAWVTLLAQELKHICKMPPSTECDHIDSAKCFNEFKNLRIVVDCTELFSETPSSLGAHKQFHSNYKHHSTVKFLVGINTGGAITYISDMTEDGLVTSSLQMVLMIFSTV